MPFNLSQIFGGWRRKEKGGRKFSQQPRVVGPLTRPSDELRGRKPPTSRQQPEAAAQPQAKAKSHSELAYNLLVSSHVSEKATMLGEGRYVFKISDRANKNLLKQAVKDRYGVEVVSVNVVAARDKKRRRGQTIGTKSGFKKAIIKLKEGQTISEF